SDVVKRIRDECSLRCRQIDQIVTDVALADCLKGKCRTAKIDCLDANGQCARRPTDGGYASYAGNEVHLCPDNWTKSPWNGLVGNMVLHELAHTCGWCHGDASGVPYDPGHDSSCWR